MQVSCPDISKWYNSIVPALDANAKDQNVVIPDIPIIDSQWIGEAVTKGHLAELTNEINDLNSFEAGDFFEQSIKFYGEFPPNSGKLYGAGIQGDVQMIVYRKDLFARLNIEEPSTVQSLIDAGERIKNAGLTPLGFSAFWCGNTTGPAPPCYDETATIVNQFGWQRGGNTWNVTTYRVKGVLDSPAMAEGLKIAQRMWALGSKNTNGGFGQAIDEMCNGRAPIMIMWMGLGPVFTAPSCAQYANFGFMPIPPDESGRNVLSLGGMGLHLAARSPRLAEAKKFFFWLMSRPVQRRWAAAGGASLRKSVVATNEYINAQPYNLVFFRSYGLTRDIWNIPEYAQLLNILQEAYQDALLGLKTPEAALAEAATKQQAIIDFAYPFGPRGKPLATPKPPAAALSKLAIGLIVGGALFLVLLAVGLLLFQRRRSKTIVLKYQADLDEAGKKLTVAEKRANSYLINISDLTFGKRIGEGAMGEVFMGTFRDTPCAIKKLKSTHMSPASLENFKREARLTAGLRHPNCVLLLGAVCKAPDFDLVLEFMSNGSLYSVLHNEGIHIDRTLAAQFALEAAMGLNYLHLCDPPILHRDFKSLNCLIDESMTLKVSDFGLAEAKRQSSQKAEDVGSLYWMAPELLQDDARGREEDVATTMSDVYAFGIVLWEIFTRCTPYAPDAKTPAPTGVSVAARVAAREGYRPTIPPTVPSAIAALMQACWHDDPARRPAFKEIISTLQGVQSSFATGSTRSVMEHRAKAPTGTVAILFSDVESSTQLWDESPTGMREALGIHNLILRSLITKHNGYEVKTEGDSFMIAFQELANAVAFSRDSQSSLLRAEWPKAVTALSYAACVKDVSTGVTLYNGLRVRMAFTWGTPTCQLDPTTRRFDYFGQEVNRCSRIEALASGGQVLCSAAAAAAARSVSDVTFVSLGSVKLKGFSKEEEIFQCTFPETSKRNFAKALVQHSAVASSIQSLDSTGKSVPNAERNAMDGAISVFMKGQSWVIKWPELELGQMIGSGSFGEVFEARWRTQPVAVKRLFNQSLVGDAYIDLYAEIAVHSTLRHPNVVLFLGAVLEPPNISIVTALQSRGNLFTLLESGQLDNKAKKKIALDICNAMAYLHACNPPVLHRDLKSLNVLLNEDNVASITDFGFATVKASAQVTTSVGSAAWMAPECIKGIPYGPLADVYSFGIVLFEMFGSGKLSDLTGGLNSVALARRTLNGGRPDETLIKDPKIREIATRCWSADPKKRPTFEDLKKELKQ